MCLSFLQDCIRWQASLKAFVVMSNHIHLIVRPEESKSVSHLMCEIKSNSKDRLFDLLNSKEKDQLQMQSGLGRRQFWKTSFRAFPLFEEDVIDQKVTYLHQNPVRAGLVNLPEDYLWSSMNLYQLDLMTNEGMVDLEVAKAFYRSLLAS